MNDFSISVIVPVYNEEEAIVDCINRNLRVLKETGVAFEIIIVDDGSRDRSLYILYSHFEQNESIKIISCEQNKGIGKAIRVGINVAVYEYILCVPVDSPLNPTLFEEFKKNAPKADIVASYRIKRKGYSWRMKLNSAMYHRLISWMFSINIKDYNWIHLYHRKIFDDRKFTVYANGIFILAEILVQAKRNGYSITEIPVHQEMRLTGIATASKFSSIIKTLSEVLQFSFRMHQKK